MSKKPVLNVRAPKNADEFVSGQRPAANSQQLAPVRTNSLANPRASGATKRRGTVQRADGEELRRITVYLPPDVAKQLLTYCFERDLKVSDIGAEAIRNFLATATAASG
jgi:hypothetical protein